jgi:hypothetical protein
MRLSGALSASAIMLAAAVLASCQHQAPPTLPPLPPQQVESNSTFNLLTPLNFPSARSELLFQERQLIPLEKLTTAAPYCKLVASAGAPLSLAPGPMRVTNVSYDEREVGQSSSMYSLTRIGLSTGSPQPSYEMRCGWPRPSSNAKFLNTEQINSAIGGQFSMQLLR